MSHPYPPRDLLPSSLELAYGRHILDQQHGPYLVATYLEQLGLADWTCRVMGYLRMYDGIDSWLEPGDIEAVAPHEIAAMSVTVTICDGRITHEA